MPDDITPEWQSADVGARASSITNAWGAGATDLSYIRPERRFKKDDGTFGALHNDPAHRLDLGRPANYPGDREASQHASEYSKDYADALRKGVPELPDEAVGRAKDAMFNHVFQRSRENLLLQQYPNDSSTLAEAQRQFAGSNIPFGRWAYNSQDAKRVEQAQGRFNNNAATSEDYRFLARPLAAAKSDEQRNWWDRTLRNTVLPAATTGAEMIPMFAAGGALAEAAAPATASAAFSPGAAATQALVRGGTTLGTVSALRQPAVASEYQEGTLGQLQFNKDSGKFEYSGGEKGLKAYAKAAAADVVQNAAFGAAGQYAPRILEGGTIKSVVGALVKNGVAGELAPDFNKVTGLTTQGGSVENLRSAYASGDPVKIKDGWQGIINTGISLGVLEAAFRAPGLAERIDNIKTQREVANNLVMKVAQAEATRAKAEAGGLRADQINSMVSEAQKTQRFAPSPGPTPEPGRAPFPPKMPEPTTREKLDAETAKLNQADVMLTDARRKAGFAAQDSPEARESAIGDVKEAQKAYKSQRKVVDDLRDEYMRSTAQETPPEPQEAPPQAPESTIPPEPGPEAAFEARKAQIASLKPGTPEFEAAKAEIAQRMKAREEAQKSPGIPKELADRIEGVAKGSGGDPQKIRDHAQGVYQAGGEDALRTLLEIQEERQKPFKPGTQEEHDNLIQEYSDLLKEHHEEIARELRRAGYNEATIRSAALRGLQSGTAAGEAAAEIARPAPEPAPSPQGPTQAAVPGQEPRPEDQAANAARGQTAGHKLDPIVETPVGNVPRSVAKAMGYASDKLAFLGIPSPLKTGKAEKLVSEPQIIQTAEALLGGKRYVLPKTTLVPGAIGAYHTLSQHIEVGKMHALNAQVDIHERAHDIAAKNGFESDPAKLPPDVAAGFQQFDYVKGQPLSPRGMQEGFAEWLRMRETDQLQNLSPEQKAAADYAEKFVKNAGLTDRLDRIKGLFGDVQKQTAAQQYAGTIAPKGQPAGPILTPMERLARAAKRGGEAVLDKVNDDVGVLGRMPGGTEAWKRGQALRWMGRNYGVNFAEHGYPNLGPDGTWVPASKSDKEVFSRLKPEEMVDGGAYDAYAKAKEHVFDYLRQSYQRQLGNKVDETVSIDQYRQARAVLDEFQQNPEQFQRFEQTNKDRIDTLNQGLRFLAQLGRFTPDWVEKQIKEHPDYASRQRVVDAMMQEAREGRRMSVGQTGTKPAFTRARSMSGEQTVGAVASFRERYADVGWLAQKQLMDEPIRKMLEQKGMGDYARLMDNKEPDDPRQWRTFKDGEPVRYMVGDDALRSYLQNRQGDGTIAKGIADLVGRVPVAKWVPKAISIGATAASPAWHAANMLPMRDPKTFLERTQNLSSVKDLYNWYKDWLGYMWHGTVAEGRDSKPWMELYERLAGDSQRFITQGRDPGEVLEGFPGFAKELMRRLSYPEQVPKALEMKNELEKMGYTRENIEQWNKTGELPPVEVQVAGLHAAGQMGHTTMQQGIDTRNLSKAIPFFGAHVANTSKWLRNWKQNPKGALMGLGLLAAMRVGYWYARKDDQDYQEQSTDTRNNFYFSTPTGRVRILGPRGLDIPIGALMDESLRYASRSNPHFDRLWRNTFESVIPGGPEPYTTGAEIWANKDRPIGGRPIVPQSDEGQSAAYNLLHHQLPFAAERATGGMLSGRVLRDPAAVASLGFYASGKPRQSFTDYYSRLHELEQKKQGGRTLSPEENQEYHRLTAFRKAQQQLSKAAKSPGADEGVLKQRQTELARRAMQR